MQLNGIKSILAGASSQVASGVGAAWSKGSLAPAFDARTCAHQADIQASIREAKGDVAAYRASMGYFAFINTDADATFHGYGSGKPQTAEITRPLPQNRLDLVVLVTVSGHDFKERPNRAELLSNRAKSNSYNIRVTHPGGRTETMSGIQANGATINVQPITINDVKPGKLVVEVWPDGSLGVGGYGEGRRLEIDYRPATAQKPS